MPSSTRPLAQTDPTDSIVGQPWTKVSSRSGPRPVSCRPYRSRARFRAPSSGFVLCETGGGGCGIRTGDRVLCRLSSPLPLLATMLLTQPNCRRCAAVASPLARSCVAPDGWSEAALRDVFGHGRSRHQKVHGIAEHRAAVRLKRPRCPRPRRGGNEAGSAGSTILCVASLHGRYHGATSF